MRDKHDDVAEDYLSCQGGDEEPHGAVFGKAERDVHQVVGDWGGCCKERGPGAVPLDEPLERQHPVLGLFVDYPPSAVAGVEYYLLGRSGGDGREQCQDVQVVLVADCHGGKEQESWKRDERDEGADKVYQSKAEIADLRGEGEQIDDVHIHGSMVC